MDKEKQAVVDRAYWPAKPVGPVMEAWSRGLAVVVEEAETVSLLEQAVSPKFLSLTFGGNPVRLLPHERCEWAFRALGEMRGERIDGAAS
jgi:hypothetical protein